MKTIAKLALSAPMLLALSACGGAEETAGTETETAMPVEETVPMDTSTEGAMAEDPMATDPAATGAMGEEPMTDGGMTPEDDAAVDGTTTADPTVPE